MADIGRGTVAAYVRELLAECFASESAGEGYCPRGGIADKGRDGAVLNQGGSGGRTGQAEDMEK